jgi:copper chaperone CopZ
MSCGGCVRHVTAALQSLPGVDVKQVEVGSAAVSRDASQTSDEAVIRALAAAGYEARKETSHDTR